MINQFVRLSLLPVLLLCCFSAASYAAQSSIDGYWEGFSKLPNDEMKFTITFKTGAGGLQGKIDVPDSGFIFASPLANVSANGSKVHFEVPRVGNVPFDGENLGDTISGTFQFNNVAVPFILKRTTPPPVPYHEEEVRFQNGSTRLAGTLLLPLTKGPHPAIVFHHAAYQDTRNAWA
ncbi:MAG TPA: hypothetical protein VGL91_13025, partial [Acidobacteriota bacterium]